MNNEKNILFIHVPKCGGTTIKNLLREKLYPPVGRGGHVRYKHYKTCKVSFKFTFVRNPWSRILSLYFYWKQMDEKHKNYRYDKVQVNEIHKFNLSFIDFVKSIPYRKYKFYCRPHLKKIIGHWIPSTECMDFIGRFENLQQDFNIICDKIGIPQQQLPHKNASKHKHYTEYYNDETRQIVAKKYAKDIEYFNYKFGE